MRWFAAVVARHFLHATHRVISKSLGFEIALSPRGQALRESEVNSCGGLFLRRPEAKHENHGTLIALAAPSRSLAGASPIFSSKDFIRG
jgi:hypothetical protein